MARGWESKNVESQQEDVQSRRGETVAREPGATDRRRTLQLARAAIVDRIARAPAGPMRAALDQALADLERELNGLPADG
jgi:hypothetical protein